VAKSKDVDTKLLGLGFKLTRGRSYRKYAHPDGRVVYWYPCTGQWQLLGKGLKWLEYAVVLP